MKVVSYNVCVMRVLAVKLRIVGTEKRSRLNTFHRSTDKIPRGLRRFVCGKGIVGWKIIIQRQGRVDDFEPCLDWKVNNGHLLLIYGSNSPFLT